MLCWNEAQWMDLQAMWHGIVLLLTLAADFLHLCGYSFSAKKVCAIGPRSVCLALEENWE